MIDLKVDPYFDDYDPEKGFYRILFRPGKAVQVRELNQLQSIIQNQIGTQGNHLFKGGSLVIPGNLSIDLNVDYVKLISETNSNPLIHEIIGKKIRGKTSGIIASIVFYSQSEDSDLPTLFVRYENSGSANQKVFLSNEPIAYASDTNNATIFTVSAANTNPTGKGSIATIENGYYFIQNTFVKVNRQTIILEKYGVTPSYKVGLIVNERDVTSNEDSTLLDNASGSYNFSAPGANRLLIDPVLTKLNLDLDETSISEIFVLLASIRSGIIENVLNQTEYSVLETNLARRTFDESGDYTVRPFKFDIKEYRNNNRGNWTQNTPYLAGDVVLSNNRYYTAIRDIPQSTGLTAPTHLIGIDSAKNWRKDPNPVFNRGVNTVVQGENITTQRSNEAKLVVSVEPGKAYVRGFEIEKVVTENVEIEKARDVKINEKAAIDTNVGNYILVSSVKGFPTTTTNEFPLIHLHDIFVNDDTDEVDPSSSLIGTARVRYFEKSSLLSGTCPNYFLSIFDIQMNPGKSFTRDVKSFTSSEVESEIKDKNFIANTFPTRVPLTGTISVDENIVTGIGTLFLSELKPGDYIEFTSNTCSSLSQYLRRVELITPNSNDGLTLYLTDEEDAKSATNSTFSRIETRIRESNFESLLYRLPYPYVKDVDGSSVTFTYMKFFDISTIASGQSGIGITVNSSPNETFQPSANPTNFILLNTNTKQIVQSGDINFTTSPDLSSVIIQGSGLIDGNSYILGAAIKTSGSIRNKTLTNFTETKTAKTEYTKPQIILQKSDGYKLSAVLMKEDGETSTSYTIDITDRYFFNDGQKTTHYDFASISLKPNQIPPEFPIQINYEYFDAGSSNIGPFTVNSYSSIAYKDIPKFNGISLSQFIDFRPVRESSQLYKVNAIPKRGYSVDLEFDYYLGRSDKIALAKTGNFFSVKGVSGIYPREPNDPSEGMVLTKIKLLPYTFDTDSVDVDIIDNKRYTMRDIGRLEKRIDNVEYYTSLSLLEQNTKSIEIIDQFGLNRFKNGFIVDSFTGHNIGDVTSIDYKCSIDMERGELRPSFHAENIPLIENVSVPNPSRNGYQVTGDLITLPYDQVDFITQESHSTFENVNPFSIQSFVGNGKLIPSSDEWFDNELTPNLVANPNNHFNTLRKELNLSEPLGTIWNSWQTQWSGVPVQSTINDFASMQTTGLSSTIEQQNVESNVRSLLVPITNRDLFDNRVVSSAVVPFLRSKSILFQFSGLKPSTAYSPLFDNINVSNFIRNEVILHIAKNDVNNPLVFDTSSRCGVNSTERGRITPSGNSLDIGDVIFVSERQDGEDRVEYNQITSPTCGLLSLVTEDNDNYYLHIVNLTGLIAEGINAGNSLFLNQNDLASAFQVGDTIQSTISNVPAIIANITVRNQIQSDTMGNATGIFDIPNNESIRFRSGVREFKLSEINGNSFSRIQYRSQGILETIQEQIISTRSSTPRQEGIVNNRVVVSTRRTSTQTGWLDPIAQTFFVDSTGGAFVTSLSLFFKKKDTRIPIKVEIRNVINGYPGPNVVPFSAVTLLPYQVAISEDTSVATQIIFPSPVYLQDETEYAIILATDSSEYEVWISEFDSNSPDSKKPFIGSLFKSQNTSIWFPNNLQALKFNLKKARFTKNTFGTVEFVPSSIQPVVLDSNPFYMQKGNRFVRVIHKNHGFDVGDEVTIQSENTNTLNAIDAQYILTTHAILHVTFDSYVFKLSESSNTPELSGYFGGNNIYTATRKIKFSSIQPVIQQLVFETTDLSHQIRISPSASFNTILSNNNNEFILSQVIENSESFTLKSLMKTTNENISPVIDLDRLSLIAIRNRIDTPTEGTNNFDSIDRIILFAPTETESFEAEYLVLVDDVSSQFTFIGPAEFPFEEDDVIVIAGFTGDFEINNGTYTITDVSFTDNGVIRTIVTVNKGEKTLVDVDEENEITVTVTLDESVINEESEFVVNVNASLKQFVISGERGFSEIIPGKYIEFDGFDTSINNGKYLVKNVDLETETNGTVLTTITVETNKTLENEEASATSLSLLNNFVDEIAPSGSSSQCKYVTKKISLKNSSTFLSIRFSATVEELANIIVYYKTEDVGTRGSVFESKNYELIEPINRIIRSDDGEFFELEYSVENLDPFDAVQVKIVIQSISESDIARIKNLVILCCA